MTRIKQIENFIKEAELEKFAQKLLENSDEKSGQEVAEAIFDKLFEDAINYNLSIL